MLLPAPLQAHAHRQFGLVTRAQALETLSAQALQRRLASGLLVPVGRGVYRFAGVAPSWRQRALASCLVVGGEVAVSHLAAAYLWRAESVATPPIQLTVPEGRRARGVRPAPHRAVLPAGDVTARWGIPTTTPARTVIDLSTVVVQPLLERIVDDLCRARLLRVEELDQRVAVGRGRSGPRHRADVLSEILTVRRRRGPGAGASPREDWVVDTLVGAGLPPPARNLVVEVGGRLRELDCAYPDRRISIEYDGWQVHNDAAHFHTDRDKAAMLQLEGWITLQVTSLWSAELLVERVRMALAQRGVSVPAF